MASVLNLWKEWNHYETCIGNFRSQLEKAHSYYTLLQQFPWYLYFDVLGTFPVCPGLYYLVVTLVSINEKAQKASVAVSL